MSPLGRISNPAMEQLASNVSPGLDKTKQSGSDFSKQLMDVLNEVNDSQQTAAAKKTDMMTGRQDVDYHDLMISMEKASVAMQLTMAVRNKILDAYQEIKNTQI